MIWDGALSLVVNACCYEVIGCACALLYMIIILSIVLQGIVKIWLQLCMYKSNVGKRILQFLPREDQVLRFDALASNDVFFI